MSAIDRVLNAESFVVPGLMQKSGVFEEIRGAVWAGFDFLEPSKAQRLREVGFSKMHEVLDFAEIAKASVRANRRVNRICMEVTRDMVARGLEYKRSFYVNRYAVTRFFAPFDVLHAHEQSETHRKDKRLCCGEAADGMIRYHGPHRDSWHGTATNNLNLWAALTDFDEGNSMFVYPEHWGKPVRHKGVYVRQTERFGKPRTFSGKAGDVLLFCADHLHGTQLNVTNNTRIVITFRFAVEAPVYPAVHEGRKQRYYDSRFVRTPLEKFHAIPPYFAPDSAKDVLRRLRVLR